MSPYTDNPIRFTHGRTRNWRDSLNIFEDSHGPEGEYNPVFKLELLGGVISQGVVAWITMVSGLLVNIYFGGWRRRVSLLPPSPPLISS